MKLTAIPLVALVLGVVLIITSVVWSSIAGNGTWTEADEAEYAAAQRKWLSLGAVGHSHGTVEHGSSDVTGEDDAAQITAEFEQQRQKLANASNRGRAASRLFWWSGLVMALAGGGFVFAQRMMGDQA